MIYINIGHTEYVMPDSVPVATLLKHLSSAREVRIHSLGNEYVYVYGKTCRVSFSNKHDGSHEVITEAEYEKRIKALRRALPAKAGPDAHGHNITKRES